MSRGRRTVYPSLGPEGLAAVVSAIRVTVHLPAKPSSDQVIVAYTELFELTYAHLSVMVGTKGAQAITQRAIKRAKVDQPAVGRAAVSDDRVVLDGVRKGSGSAQKLQVEVEHLFLMTMDVLASLIGVDLLITVLEKLTSRKG